MIRILKVYNIKVNSNCTNIYTTVNCQHVTHDVIVLMCVSSCHSFFEGSECMYNCNSMHVNAVHYDGYTIRFTLLFSSGHPHFYCG